MGVRHFNRHFGCRCVCAVPLRGRSDSVRATAVGQRTVGGAGACSSRGIAGRGRPRAEVEDPEEHDAVVGRAPRPLVAFAGELGRSRRRSRRETGLAARPRARRTGALPASPAPSRPGAGCRGACSPRTAAPRAPRSPPGTATPPARWSRAPSRPLACSAGNPRARANGPSRPRPRRTPGSTPDPRRGNGGTLGRWSRQHHRWSGPPRGAGRAPRRRGRRLP